VTGWEFVGSDLTFSGYTDGGSREVIDRMLSTDDLGHFDAHGRLFIDGREDDMIVSGGENVYPTEIENLLVEHPGVADALVVGVPDREFGERVRAYVVAAPLADPHPDELKVFVGSSLGRYKVPRDIVSIDELPRNPTGKPAPEPDGPEPAGLGVLAASARAGRLIWKCARFGRRVASR